MRHPKLIKLISSLIMLSFNHQNPQGGLHALSISWLHVDYFHNARGRSFRLDFVNYFKLFRNGGGGYFYRNQNIFNDHYYQ
jgi:hypothetical protein